MLRLLIDHDFDQDILRGLLRRIPELDFITAYQAGLSTATDPALLAWAAQEKRLIVTHDWRTMPSHAANRIAAGEPIAGLVVVSRRLSISLVIDELEIIVMCSDEADWGNTIKRLPL